MKSKPTTFRVTIDSYDESGFSTRSHEFDTLAEAKGWLLQEKDSFLEDDEASYQIWRLVKSGELK